MDGDLFWLDMEDLVDSAKEFFVVCVHQQDMMGFINCSWSQCSRDMILVFFSQRIHVEPG